MKQIQLSLLVALMLATSAFAVPVPVGGGAMEAGWRGEYFANAD